MKRQKQVSILTKMGIFSYLLEEANDLNVILKAHLVIEHKMGGVLELFVEKPDIIINNFSFYNKVCILESMNAISSDLLLKIKNLNIIRNKCAHQLHYRITDKDIDSIYSPSSGMRKIMAEAKDFTKKFKIPSKKINLRLILVIVYLIGHFDGLFEIHNKIKNFTSHNSD